jgi:hypothetical protein
MGGVSGLRSLWSTWTGVFYFGLLSAVLLSAFLATLVASIFTSVDLSISALLLTAASAILLRFFVLTFSIRSERRLGFIRFFITPLHSFVIFLLLLPRAVSSLFLYSPLSSSSSLAFPSSSAGMVALLTHPLSWSHILGSWGWGVGSCLPGQRGGCGGEK